jgi:predicted ATPase
VARAVTAVNPAAAGLTLDVPGAQRISVDLSLNGSIMPLDVRQESEGFRRFLAHLLALYQIPSKQTLLFEHPETGLHPGALEALFEEFQACPGDGRGQIALTTHSPQLLDFFAADNIRLVDIDNLETKIGPLAPEQSEVLKEALLHPGELLTVDPARLAGQLAEVPE